MNSKQKSLLTLTMIALVVGTINGVFDIIYNFQRTFEVSVVNDYEESLKVKVVADSGRPPFLWYLAWRVGSNIVTTVNIGITVIPSGTNIGNLKVTYYIKGVSGANSKKFLSATSLSATSGQEITNSTGDVDIDTHLSAMGLSTTQDQTVNYTVYCKVEGTGLISGETLIAEIPETQFDSILYDYGVIQSGIDTYEASKDAYWDVSTATWYYDGSYMYIGVTDRTSYVGWDDINIPSGATINQVVAQLNVYYRSTDASDVVKFKRINSWAFESGKPTDIDSTIISASAPLSTGWWETPDLKSIFQVNNGFFGLYIWIDPMSSRVDFYTKDSAQLVPPKLIVDWELYDWTASWSWFNLPLSVVSLPIGTQFVAILIFLVLYFAWLIRYVKKKKAKGRGKRKK